MLKLPRLQLKEVVDALPQLYQANRVELDGSKDAHFAHSQVIAMSCCFSPVTAPSDLLSGAYSGLLISKAATWLAARQTTNFSSSCK